MIKKKRKSNLELLRILAMLMIITLHFFSTVGHPADGTGNELVYYVYESLAICGVDIFVLLTGFFSLNQNYVNTRKIIKLVIDVAFWCFIGFMLCVLFGEKVFALKELIRYMFPIVFGGRWFVKAYILLMLLFPFVNRVLTTINRKTYQALLAVQLFLFSVWPSFLPNPPLDDYGYSFVHLITIYMIGGYLRLHVKKYPPKWLCFLGYVVSFGIVLLSKLLNQGYEWAYNYPFVMAEAICLFMLFSQVALQSDLLNLVASSAFGVYLIHTNVFFGPLGYEKLFHGSSLNKGSILLMILAIPICAVFFYLSGFVLESLKSLVFRYSVDSVLDRIKILNTPIMVEGEEKE